MASSLGKMASPLGPTKCISTPSRVSNFLQRRVLPGPPTRVDPRPLDFARYKISKGTFCSRIGVEPRGGPAQEKNPVGYF
jgi:hypothetical protein